VLILGLTSKTTFFSWRPPLVPWWAAGAATWVLEISGMLESAVRCAGTMSVTLKVAFTAGSSQQGKALRWASCECEFKYL
jgi:hypothetical protein